MTTTSTRKPTKAQLIADRIAAGRTRLEAEIEVANEQHAARMARLAEAEARETARVQARIVELLQSQHRDVFDALDCEARAEIAKKSQSRSEKAKASRKSGTINEAAPGNVEQAAAQNIQDDQHLEVLHR